MMDNNNKWLDDYFKLFINTLNNNTNQSDLIKIKERFLTVAKNKKKIMIAGNGGSASIASHCAVDLTKNAKIKSINFNEASLITCFANDYGYENWLAQAIQFYGVSGDVAVLISSSGKSHNMVNAAQMCRKMNIYLITLTGFKKDNPLKQLGDINLWINSSAYNIVEMIHQFWLLAVVDMIIGSAEYSS